MRTRTTDDQSTRSRRRHLLVAVAVLALLLAACSGSDGSDDSAGMGTAAEDTADGGGDFGLEGREVAEAAAPGEDERTSDSATDSGEPADEGSGDQAQAPVDTSPPGTAATGERIIKEGTVTLEVPPGEFDSAFSQVVARAQALGGHVSGSSSSSDPAVEPDDPALVSGQVTIRVPVRGFEDLLTAVGDAGEIVDRTVTSQDVTAEYTDLESRQRHLQAQERFYLGLLEDAASVPDAIAVQQQLDGVQGQIEEITGRLNLLGDRSAFSTLTVRIREQGAPDVLAAEGSAGGLTPYLRDAADVFISTVGAIIVVATFLAPFAVLLLLAYGLWRAIRPGRTRKDAPALPITGAPAAAPVPPDQREPAGVGAGPSTATATEQRGPDAG